MLVGRIKQFPQPHFAATAFALSLALLSAPTAAPPITSQAARRAAISRSECASSAETYYDVQNVQDRVPAFQAIGEQLSQLRIAR